MDVMGQLHRSLDTRMTPEAVASLVLRALGSQLLPAQRRVLERAAAAPAARYSSMGDDFDRPVPIEHKTRMLAAMLGKDPTPVLEYADDPWRMAGALRMLAPYIGWNPAADYPGRLNRAGRAQYGVDLSRRRYNRLMRHLARMQTRIGDMQRQVLLRQLVMVDRTGLAYSITAEEMRADPYAGCFAAYWTAQRKRRRAFTLAGRDNPFDTIAQALLDLCMARGEATDWWLVARVYPQPVVVARLDDARRGELMGRWFGFMKLAADMLRDLHADWPTREVPPVLPDDMWRDRPGLMPSPEARGARTEQAIDRALMIVRRGVDSSTWNTVAGAYNAARAGWINCAGAAGALDLLDPFCPGKAMRLMAGDLASWHHGTGGGVDPQTKVWAALPPPWEVLSGRKTCTAEMVESVCREHGVDPHAAGWTAPRQIAGDVAQWQPTPELVHGVEVADSLWAGLLRSAGVFSGKTVRAGWPA